MICWRTVNKSFSHELFSTIAWGFMKEKDDHEEEITGKRKGSSSKPKLPNVFQQFSQ